MNRRQFSVVYLVLDMAALCSVFFFVAALLSLCGQSINPIYFLALSFVLSLIAVFWRVIPKYRKSKGCFRQVESRKILEEKAITALAVVVFCLTALPLKTAGCLSVSFAVPVSFLFWGACLLTLPVLFARLIKQGEIGGKCADEAYQLFVGLTLISIVANAHHLLLAVLDSAYLDLLPLGYTLKPLLQILLSFGFIVKYLNAFWVAFVFLSWLRVVTARHVPHLVLEKERADIEHIVRLTESKTGLTGKIAIVLGVLTLLLVPPSSLYCELKPVINGVTFPLFVPGISGAYFLAGVALITYQLLVPPAAREYIRVGLRI